MQLFLYKQNVSETCKLVFKSGGAAGAAMMAGAVALGTYYAATRQKGSPPMFPLDEQAFLEYEVKNCPNKIKISEINHI